MKKKDTNKINGKLQDMTLLGLLDEWWRRLNEVYRNAEIIDLDIKAYDKVEEVNMEITIRDIRELLKREYKKRKQHRKEMI